MLSRPGNGPEPSQQGSLLGNTHDNTTRVTSMCWAAVLHHEAAYRSVRHTLAFYTVAQAPELHICACMHAGCPLQSTAASII